MSLQIGDSTMPLRSKQEVTMKNFLIRVNFTTEELRGMPKLHSGFFVTSCLAVNEIWLSLRLYLMTMNTLPKEKQISDPALREYAFCQFQMIERGLGSKIFEYLNLLGDYKKKCDRAKDTVMKGLIDPIMDTVHNSVRCGAEYELARWYRNTVSSHYIVSDITELMMTADLADEHSIYLHEKSGNANYLLGEQILIGKLSEGGKTPEETAAALVAYGKWVENTARYVLDIHHKFTVALFQAFFSNKVGERFEINPEPYLIGNPHETPLPILWDLSEDT
jgi:hypothetical protein